VPQFETGSGPHPRPATHFEYTFFGGPFGERVGAMLTPYKPEFFGSFLQKQLLAFCYLPQRPAARAKVTPTATWYQGTG
jgi:hypothetical protein